MARKQPIRGRIRKARDTARGMRLSGVGPLKFLRLVVEGNLEQRAANKQYKREHGKAAYRAARRRDRETDRYYNFKHWGF